jgi:hypothetical protein
VVNDIVHEQIKVIGAETIRTAKEQKALALREEISRRLLLNVVDDVIYSECLELSTAVAKETITLRFYSILIILIVPSIYSDFCLN